MNGVEGIILWIGQNFTVSLYLSSSKIQGILWSLADIVLVFSLLRIADLSRRRAGKRSIVLRYVVLGLSAAATPILIFSQTPRQFFLLECLICGSQFAILLYTLIAEQKGIRHLLKDMVARDSLE